MKNMQLATSHKQVLYTPMNHGDFQDYMGLPDTQNRSDDGYLIEYLDKLDSNHPEHENYIEWVSLDYFINNYYLETNKEIVGNYLIKLQIEVKENMPPCALKWSLLDQIDNHILSNESRYYPE